MDIEIMNTRKLVTGISGKTQRKMLGGLRKTMLFSMFAAIPLSASGDPIGGRVVDGQAEIGRAGNNTTLINQRTQRVSIDWESFNVDVNERVVFQQPNSSSTALNRIFDQNPSQIFGAIDANGRVILINPNGMLFGESAKLNIHSLLATSLDISLEDFKSGNYDLKQLANAQGGAIINRGLIQAATGGSISLVGGEVENSGLIVADYGQVNLASGRQATIDFDGDGMLMFAVDLPEDELSDSRDGAGVLNTGTIQANGGQVLLSATTARDVIGSVVNNEGVVRAQRIENQGGVIRLVGGPTGTTLSSGELDVSSDSGVAGRVEMTGQRVGLLDNARIDASGRDGGGVVRVGGGRLGNDNSVMNADFVYMAGGSSIDASATANGDGGDVVLWSDDTTRVYGDISVAGGAGGGDGGFVETSGKYGLVVTDAPNTAAAAGNGGEWLIDPISLSIVATGEADSGIDTDVVGTLPDPLFTSYTSNDAAVSELSVDTILAGLTDGDVTIITSADANPLDVDDPGNITWEVGAELDIDGLLTANNELTLIAINDILFNGSIVDSIGGDDLINLTLTAGNLIVFDGSVNLGLGGAGGAFASDSQGFSTSATSTIVAPGGVTLDVVDAATLAGAITTSSVAINASAAAGTTSIDVGGTLTGASLAITTLAANDTITVGATATGTTVSAGAGNDEININSAVVGNVLGGDGNDAINVSAAVTGNVDGENDSDTITLTSAGSATNILGGGAGGASNVDTISSDGTNVWNVTGADAGSVSIDGSGLKLWSGFEVILGGAAADTFTMATGFAGSLNGGGGVDIFTISNTVGGNVRGGDGNDIINVNAAVTGNVDGESDSDTITLTSGGSAASIVGGGAGGLTNSDTISAAGTNIWNITGADAGSVSIDGGGLKLWSGFEVILGGAAVDTFNMDSNFAGTLNGGGAADVFNIDNPVGGNIRGGDGNDRINLNAAVTGFVDGENDSDTITLTSTGSAASIVGGGAGGLTNSDTISAAGTNIWNVTGADAGTVSIDGGGLKLWSGFEVILGGAAVDTFNMDSNFAGTLNGGADADVFNVDNPVGGNVFGGDGNDIINLNAAVTGSVDGQNDNDAINLAVTGSAASILGGDGGTDSDAIFAGDGLNLWNVTGADAGTVDIDGNGPVAFSGFEVLSGGDGVDEFAMASGFDGTLDGGGNDDIFDIDNTVAGDVLGGAGDDEINLNATVTGDVDGQDDDDTINLTAPGLAANILGGDGGTNVDSIFAGDGTNIWNVTASNAGNVSIDGGGAVTFSGFETLSGGDGVDEFTMASGFGGTLEGGGDDDVFDIDSAVAGDVLGGAGNDEINLNAAVTGDVDGQDDNDTINLTSLGSAANILGGDGGTDIDTIFADDGLNLWNVTGADSGTVDIDGNGPVAFSGFEVLSGGDGVDEFAMASGFDGTLDGGGNDDFFDIDNTVAGDVLGGAGDDEINLNATVTGDVDGQDDDDTINLTAPGLAANILGGDGGTNVDSIFAGDGTNIWNVTASNAGNVSIDGGGAVTFSGFETLSGGDGVDEFTMASGFGGTLAGGGDDDVFDIDSAVAGDVLGGAGNDEINLNAAVTGDVDGQDDNDTINLTSLGSAANIRGGDGGTNIDFISAGDGTNVWTLSAADAGNVDNGGITATPFSGFENLQGGAGTDDLIGPDADIDWNLTAAGEGSVAPAAGAPVIAFTGIEAITAGSGVDVFTIAADFGGDLTGNDGNDEFTVNATVTYTGNLSGGDDNDVFIVDGDLTGDASGDAGMDMFTVNGTGSVLGDLLGGADIDIFTVDGSVSGDLVGGTENDVFTVDGDVIGDVLGDNGNDEFTVNGTVTGNVFGGAGNDIFNLNGDVTLNADGQDDDDQFNLSASGTAGAILGGDLGFTNVDTLFAGNGTNAWVLTAANAGSVDIGPGDVKTFSGFEVLQGGTGSDVLDGLNLDSTWNLTGPGVGSVTPTVGVLFTNFNGFEAITAGTAVDIFTVSGDAFGDIDGGDGIDMLTSGAGGASFIVANPNVLLLDGVVTDGQITNVENVTGGIGDDFFTINANYTGDLAGGGGVDTFTVADGAVFEGNLSGDDGDDIFTVDMGGQVTGDLLGGAGIDTFDISGMIAGNVLGGGGNDVLTLAGMVTASIDGEGDDDTINLTADGSAGAILGGDGGSNSDTVFAGDGSNIWNLTGANQGNVDNGGLAPSDFAGFENLLGGTGDDTFNLDVGSLSGNVTGGDGTNAYFLAVAVTGAIIGGTGNDIVTLVGSGSAGDLQGGNGGGQDTLIGPDSANSWDIGVDVDGVGNTVNGVQAFTEFETLAGGNAEDDFAIASNFAGTLDGGDGEDTFTLTDNVAVALIDGGQSQAMGIDRLNAFDVDNDWLIDGNDQGSLVNSGTTAFVDIGYLTGGSSNDDFVFAAAGSLESTLEGGAGGVNSLTAGDVANDWILDSARGGELGVIGQNFSQIDTVTGGSQNDDFSIEATFAGDVSGAAGDDTFEFMAGGNIGGLLQGDAGADRIDMSQFMAESTITLTGAGTIDGYNGTNDEAISIDGFENIDRFTGNGTGGDNVIGPNLATAWILTDADVFTAVTGSTGSAEFTAFSNIAGGSDNDVFTVTVDGSLAEMLSGGGGMNELIGADDTNMWMLDMVNGSNVNNLSFADIQTLTGGSGVDTFEVNGAVANLTVAGGDGLDEIQGDNIDNDWNLNGADSGSLNTDEVIFSSVENVSGGSEVDTFAIDASVTGTVNGGAGNDVFTLSSDVLVNAGAIEGDDGNDEFNLDITSGQRTVAFDGGTGDDNVILTGAPAGLTEVVDSSAGTVQFSASGVAGQTITMAGVEDLTTSVEVNEFTIASGSASASLSTPVMGGTNVFDTATGLDIDFDNKPSLELDMTATALSIDTDFSVEEFLGISAMSLATSGTLGATDLELQNLMLLNPLSLAVNTLSMSSVSGMLTFTDEDDLDLLDVVATGDVSIEAETLTVTDGSSVEATGDIALTSGQALNLNQGAGVMAMGGTVTLAGDSIEQSQGSSITAAGISANSQGGMNLVGANTADLFDIANAAGDVMVSSAGTGTSTFDVSNTGGAVNITHAGDMDIQALGNTGANSISTLTAAGDMSVTGAVASDDALSLTAMGGYSQSGSIVTGADMDITANSLAVNGTVTGSSDVSLMATGGDMSISSAIDSGDQLTMMATGAYAQTQTANVSAAGDMSITANSVAVDSGLNGGSQVTLLATGGDVSVSGAITSTDMLAMTASGAYIQTGTVASGANLDVTANNMAINGAVDGDGEIALMATGGDMSIASAVTSGQQLTMSASGAYTQSGDVTSAGNMSVTADSMAVNGQLSGDTDVALMTTGGDMSITDSVGSGGLLNVMAAGAYAQAGDVSSGGAMSVAASSVSVDGAVNGGGEVSLQATGGNMSIAGAVTSNDALTMAAAGNYTQSANITSGGAMAVTANSMSVNGGVNGSGNVSLQATGGNMSIAGAVASDDALTMSAAGAYTQSADVSSGGAMTVTASGVTVNGGINGTSEVALTATGGNVSISQSGAVTTGGELAVNAMSGDYMQSGMVMAGADMMVNAIDFTVNGGLTGGNNVSFTGSGTYAQNGTVTADNDFNIDVNAINFTGSNTSMSTSGNIDFVAADQIILGNLTASQGSISLFTNNGDIFAGSSGAVLLSDNIVITGIGQVGTLPNPIEVRRVSGSGKLALESPTNINPNITLFFEGLAEFDVTGVRSLNSIDPAAQRGLAASAQSQSSTISASEGSDTSVFDPTITLVVVEGRGVTIPCSQAEDPEEACQ